MAVLIIPDKQTEERNPSIIKAYLNQRHIWFDQWEASKVLDKNASQDEVLDAYNHVLKPYMEVNGYLTADVLNVHEETPNLLAIRNKFLKEHRHTEDEVRFFVDGSGYFWFNLEMDGEPIFAIKCEAGDLISVPANTAHWFDLGSPVFVKAIRIFIDMSGWVPLYTESGVDEKFNPVYS